MPVYELPSGIVVAISDVGGFQTLDIPAPPGGYDLATALAGVPFTIDQPTAPTITSEAFCNTEAEFTASVAVNGRRTILEPGTYTFGSNVSIGGNDKEIVFQSGAVVNLPELQFSSAARVRVLDAVINASGQYGIRPSSSTDLDFEGLVLDAADSGFIPTSCTRMRFLSSEITAAVHVGYIELGNSHFTIANSNLVSTQPFGGINGWCIRWGDVSAANMVLMDSQFRCEQNVTLRYEVSQINGYFARNQIVGNNPFRTEGRDGGTPEAWPLNWLYFIDNYMYPFNETGGIYVIVTSYPRMQDVTATGNRTVGPGSGIANVGFPTGQDTWTTGDNSHITAPLGPPPWVMQ